MTKQQNDNSQNQSKYPNQTKPEPKFRRRKETLSSRGEARDLVIFFSMYFHSRLGWDEERIPTWTCIDTGLLGFALAGSPQPTLAS
uniref:Uncharacterized protein n=1 Tax=Candidatus Kentrum sp. FW TaxID=2126338 RepID=A0A450TM96_9GAMM|nr:MAG: hypothetical protein BECKFW1821C_GA0114237_101633 [Candidatus Kentron sp. FW]